MLDLRGDTLDPMWWKRIGIVTDYTARKLRTQLMEYKHDFNMALIGYDNQESTFKLHQEQSAMLRNSIAAQLMPWVDTGPKTLQESIADLRKRYLQRFPDPSSEKGRAAVAKQLATWKEKQRGTRRRKPSKGKLFRKRTT